MTMPDKIRMADLANNTRQPRQPSLYFDVDNLEVSSSDDESSSSDSPGFGGRRIGGGRGRGAGPTPFFRGFPHHRPLIDFVRNEWQTNPSYRSRRGSSQSSSPNREAPKWIQALLAVISAPKFRRYLTMYVILLSVFWAGWKGILKPRLDEHAALIKSLDIESQQKVGGWFGSNARPPLADIIQTRTLDPSLLPREGNGRRLVIVGDVHGCKDELDKLLKKVSFDTSAGDHLIFTGDMINKGPHSSEVVDLARRLHASCVRGNHEDRILLLRQQMKINNSLQSPSDKDDKDASRSDYRERKVARQLSDEQAAWLEACPVILKVGQITGMGNVVVVHGGLVPGLDLERQDPASVMTMRTIDLDTHVPSASRNGVAWSKVCTCLPHSTP
ncbi:hypothetical protein VTN77DRAFT_2854 [Rasamsonia byssochlamydoides]|uniref:uncharacterized protein n=1 Tax=Rasamsonia byssochlamydoides TaxID=89139 RepID=UPI0037432E3E